MRMNCLVIRTAVKSVCLAGQWFEVTPHEAGFTALNLFVPTSHLGSKFQGGELLQRRSEMDMVELQGAGYPVANFIRNIAFLLQKKCRGNEACVSPERTMYIHIDLTHGIFGTFAFEFGFNDENKNNLGRSSWLCAGRRENHQRETSSLAARA